MRADNDNLDKAAVSGLDKALGYYMSEGYKGKPYDQLSFADVYCFQYDEGDEELSDLWGTWLSAADDADEAFLYSDSISHRVNSGLLDDDDPSVSDAINGAFEAAAVESWERHNFFEALLLKDSSYFKRNPPRDDTTALYRHYDGFGRLLYVGISINSLSRFADHRNNSHWANDISKITIERFPSRDDALKAERQAIISEMPMHNIIHNRRRVRAA